MCRVLIHLPHFHHAKQIGKLHFFLGNILGYALFTLIWCGFSLIAFAIRRMKMWNILEIGREDEKNYEVNVVMTDHWWERIRKSNREGWGRQRGGMRGCWRRDRAKSGSYCMKIHARLILQLHFVAHLIHNYLLSVFCLVPFVECNTQCISRNRTSWATWQR